MRERAERERAERREAIREQIENGRLVIRKATAEERAGWPTPREPRRKRISSTC
jgi:hypothetical protein